MRVLSLSAMAVLYGVAGIAHFVHPEGFVKIMPPWLPWHLELVWLSGAIEIALALLLLPPATRPWAAWGVIALLIAVFPANLQMALDFRREGNPYLWVALVRLPLQLVLVAWAWRHTRPVA